MGIPMIVERRINDVIPIDNALNESMLNPSILEKGITNEIDDGDEKVLVQENDESNEDDEINDGDEEVLIQEGDESNEDDEIIPNNISGNNEITLDNDETKVENVKKEDSGNESHKQTRRSERIKKQRVEINPDDIGEDDNENDKDYK